MDKIFRDKPAKGQLEKELENLNDSEKAIFRAQKLTEVNLPGNFEVRGLNIKITGFPTLVNGLLRVWVAASRNGVGISINNPLLFKNPPLCVRDGTFRVVKGIEGGDMEIANFREDPLEALKEIIAQAIEFNENKK